MKLQARRLVLTGRVQGVGYRPFVYNRAIELGLTGTVYNGSGKVFVHAEGDPASLDQLEKDLVHAAPPLARPQLASLKSVAAGVQRVLHPRQRSLRRSRNPRAAGPVCLR